VNLRRRDVRQLGDERLACAWWKGNYEGDKRSWHPQGCENSQRSFAGPSSSGYLVPLNYWTKPSTTPSPSLEEGLFTVTHPFHPLYGQQFEILTYRHNWGEYRVTFYETSEHVRTLPAAWTSIVPSDPGVVLAAGRSAFRLADLLALAHLLQHIEQRQKEGVEC